jgi:transposase InsO family protein
VTRYVYQGLKRDLVLKIAGITKHQYYYQKKPGKQGRRPSKTCLKMVDNEIVKVMNEEVVNSMTTISEDPDTDYGYHKMTFALMLLGYIINHKKVYRLMQENMLLKERYERQPRPFVKYRRVIPEGPLQVLEMDIKFVWVEEHRRHAFILTAIDTFTRVLLGRKTAYNIKQSLVQELWEEIIENHLQPYNCLNRKIDIEVRNDNDSRFVAKNVQKFFKENSLNQVFTHPYTPQENGHIESFHAILSKMLNRYRFWSLEDLDQCLTLFYEKYNNQRIHASTLHLPPMFFWQQWQEGNVSVSVNHKRRITKFKLLIPYHQLSGNMSLQGVPCPQLKPLDGVENENYNEKCSAATFLQPSV